MTSCLLLSPRGGPRDRLQEALESSGYAVRSVSRPADAVKSLDDVPRPSALIVSQRLGGAVVRDLIRRGSARQVPVLVLGADRSDLGLDAASEAATDFVAAPAEAAAVLRRLGGLLRRATPAGDPGGLARAVGLVGASKALRAVLERIARISRYRTNVLVLGESGTGKELVARALHACGPRRADPFVPLNCAALGRDIIENELFGHERGAFTGANERKRGLFELADGGTLFLDEIGEVEASTQSKLLRVLERNEFRRVGGSGKIKVDVSVIAATKELDQAVEAGRFREDLYHRLRVVTVVVPPLRARTEDLPALVEHFLAGFNRRHGARLEGFTPAAIDRLVAHDWPGNIRELEHVVESAAILAAGATITAADVAPLLAPARRRSSATSEQGALSVPLGLSLPEVERRFIEATLPRFDTRAEAASALGIGLRTLYTKLRGYERRG